MLHNTVRALRFAFVSALFLVGLTSAAFTQTETVLYGFQAPGDGAVSLAGLIRDHAGNFYGTTADGGATGHGTVFKLDTAGNETVLHSFSGTDGANPRAELIRDTAGNLFGTTYFGGASNFGTVFKISWSGKFIFLYSFTGGTDGGNPSESLLRDPADNLYGTTLNGGNLSCPSTSNPVGCGVVFKVDPSGKETVLHSFDWSDGAFPTGLVAGDGSFYGTTTAGGTAGWGTVYKLDRIGSRQETVLHSFVPSTTSDAGLNPYGRLFRDRKGNLYGTTYFGGNENACIDYNGCGAVFKLDPSGNLTVLHAFNNYPDGQGPLAGVIRDAKGNLYGTTSGGGSAVFGTVFKIDVTGKETVLHSFNGTDGAYPSYGTLLRDQEGNLYGTTPNGGSNIDNLNGVVFKITQ